MFNFSLHSDIVIDLNGCVCLHNSSIFHQSLYEICHKKSYESAFKSDYFNILFWLQKWQKCYFHNNILKKEILLFEEHYSSAERNLNDIVLTRSAKNCFYSSLAFKNFCSHSNLKQIYSEVILFNFLNHFPNWIYSCESKITETKIAALNFSNVGIIKQNSTLCILV